MARLLVVNDDADLLMMCQVILEAAGHEVKIATEGNVVIALVADFKPELIVLDWVLEDTNGGEVLRRLDAGRAPRPRVLMMSALDRVAGLARILGAEGFLRKPFSAEALVEAVTHARAVPRNDRAPRRC